MQLLPLTLLWDRIERDRNVSDTDLFAALVYLGEAITKLAVSAMLGATSNDRDRARYAISYELVRADGIGDWAKDRCQKALLFTCPREREVYVSQSVTTSAKATDCWADRRTIPS